MPNLTQSTKQKQGGQNKQPPDKKRETQHHNKKIIDSLNNHNKEKNYNQIKQALQQDTHQQRTFNSKCTTSQALTTKEWTTFSEQCIPTREMYHQQQRKASSS